MLCCQRKSKACLLLAAALKLGAELFDAGVLCLELRPPRLQQRLRAPAWVEPGSATGVSSRQARHGAHLKVLHPQ